MDIRFELVIFPSIRARLRILSSSGRENYEMMQFRCARCVLNPRDTNYPGMNPPLLKEKFSIVIGGIQFRHVDDIYVTSAPFFHPTMKSQNSIVRESCLVTILYYSGTENRIVMVEERV